MGKERMLLWHQSTTGPKGRSRRKWVDDISEGIKTRGTSLKEVEETKIYMESNAWNGYFADGPKA